MGRKRAETTIEERKMITNLHNQCKSFAEISQIVSRPRSTIQSIIDRYGVQKRLQNNSRNGRPRKINQYTGQVIIKMIKRSPEISTIKITEYLKNSLNIGVSISTVRSFVRNQGFHGWVTRGKYPFAGEGIFNIFRSDAHCTTLEEKGKKIKNWDHSLQLQFIGAIMNHIDISKYILFQCRKDG